MWTDRHAGTIVQVSLDKNFVSIQEDRATRVDMNGQSESQEYHYEPNKNGCLRNFRFGAMGWKEVIKNEKTGRWIKAGGCGLRIGEREEYRDPCF